MVGKNAYHYAKRGAWIGIIVKTAMAAGYAVSGLMGNSAALLAATADSLGDMLSSLAVLIGLTVAAALPDREHPYGHGKAEPVAGKAVAIVVILGAVGVFWKSVWGLFSAEQHPSPEAFTIVVAFVGIIINEGLFRYQDRVARKVGSAALSADAWNHRTDALAGVVVLIGVAGARIGGPEWGFLDHAAGAIVAIIVLYVGVQLFRRTSLELMDTRLPEEQMAAIRSIIESVSGVKGVDMVRARKSGLVVFLDVHILVDKSLTVEDGHNIASRVRLQVKNQMPEVADVLVHVEPYSADRLVEHL